MSQSHIFSDGLTRIRNAQLVGKQIIELQYSKLVEKTLQIMVEEGYISSVNKVSVRKGVDVLKVALKYDDLGASAINEISVVSKPGKRSFGSYKDMKTSYGGLGIYILSTPKGVMSDFHARQAKVGGEVLCKVF